MGTFIVNVVRSVRYFTVRPSRVAWPNGLKSWMICAAMAGSVAGRNGVGVPFTV